MDTIFALATPVGGAIAIIRASGPDSVRVLWALTGKDFSCRPRQLLHAALFYGHEKLDDAMAVYFAAPGSYTGEDMFELHCHGGPAVVSAVQTALAANGLQPAAPGDFTRRAFLNGKMDLSQAEAVMDVIQAEAALSARAALLQLQGRLRREILEVEQKLMDALSAVSAAIDYPEELEEDVYADLPVLLLEAKRMLAALVAQGERGRILREGFRVVLLGAPNAGKSSLLNALLGRERAIVTPLPGTTRDTLEELIPIEGLPVLLTDTAGIREAGDEAELEGVNRAKAAAKNADAILVVLDGSTPLSGETRLLLEETTGMPRVIVRAKADLPPCWEALQAPDTDALPVSALTGEGLDTLRRRIVLLADPAATSGSPSALRGSVTGGAYVTNQRHISALRLAAAAVEQAREAADVDCAAIDIRDALVALGSITGRAVDEDVLDAIFARFCVGK